MNRFVDNRLGCESYLSEDFEYVVEDSLVSKLVSAVKWWAEYMVLDEVYVIIKGQDLN